MSAAATLFISDLHLDPSRPEITELFMAFLQRARGADGLYILGDLFEAWIGDDDDAAIAQTVRAGLQSLAADGVPVFLMRGNRDFLLGETFEHQSGCRLLVDPTVIDLYGERTLLMHGDLLCTDDIEYQRFRAKVHDPAWQQAVLAKPLAERREMASTLRGESLRANAGKQAELMDVNPHSVENTMREQGVRRLIHGHTHRPAIHDFVLDGAPARRIVLGDWYDQGSMLRCGPQGCELITLPADQTGC